LSQPKVSICIPAYQEPVLLRRALQSVFDQSFENYEVIITDDSADRAVEKIVKEFLPNTKLRYYKNASRKGTPENWNEAVRLARGEYIKILHHDDWFAYKDSLMQFVKMLDDNAKTDFAFCSSTTCGPDEKMLFIHRPSNKQLKKLRHNPAYLVPHNFIGAPSATIYRKSVNITFDHNLKWVVDIDFYLRILRQNNSFAFCEHPLVNVTTGSANQVTASVMQNGNVQLFEWLTLLKKVSTVSSFSLKQLLFGWTLIRKYNVRSFLDITNIGIEPPIPRSLIAFLFVQKLISRR
jgi:glycosyltransferase involved in cell wall biosynthesis